MTLNKFNGTTGNLNPALKSAGYSQVAEQLITANPAAKSSDSLIPAFESHLKTAGLRATTESFTEYCNAKLAGRRAIPAAPAKKVA